MHVSQKPQCLCLQAQINYVCMQVKQNNYHFSLQRMGQLLQRCKRSVPVHCLFFMLLPAATLYQHLLGAAKTHAGKLGKNFLMLLKKQSWNFFIRRTYHRLILKVNDPLKTNKLQ